MHTKKTNNTNKLIQISYHFVLTKIQKLQNLKKKKKKKTFFLYRSVRPVLPEIGRYGRYGRYEAGTAGIFSGTKQGSRVYRIAGRYGIFRPVQPVRYGIDIHDSSRFHHFRHGFCSWGLLVTFINSKWAKFAEQHIFGKTLAK